VRLLRDVRFTVEAGHGEPCSAKGGQFFSASPSGSSREGLVSLDFGRGLAFTAAIWARRRRRPEQRG